MPSRLFLLAALCAGLAATPAAAQQRTAASGGEAATVDVRRLPLNLGRIGRQLRQSEVREERNGLNLRYTVDVYGQAPRIEIITPQTNVLTGAVPGSAPTHNEMLQMMTPPEFRQGGVIFGSLPRRK